MLRPQRAIDVRQFSKYMSHLQSSQPIPESVVLNTQCSLKHHQCCRTAVLLGFSLGTAVIYALVALAGLKTLLACSVLAGLAFGAHWALMPCCTSDLFGPRHFAANQSIVHLSTAVGALLLSTELAATLFQERGIAHGDPPTTCFGSDCFRFAPQPLTCDSLLTLECCPLLGMPIPGVQSGTVTDRCMSVR